MKLGIIEEVQTQGDTGQVVYLPSKEVVKEERSTTKVSIVFDASAKYKDTISLNDVLYKGPCLNVDLHSLLLNFRVRPVVLTADIEKAYLQINIDEEYRDYLRFLKIFMMDIYPFNDQCSHHFRNHSVGLLCKSTHWFLYDGNIGR